MLVRSRRLELPRAFAHNDLNVARLPVPPRPHSRKSSACRSGAALGRARPLAKHVPAGNGHAPAHFGTLVNKPLTMSSRLRYARSHDRRPVSIGGLGCASYRIGCVRAGSLDYVPKRRPCDGPGNRDDQGHIGGALWRGPIRFNARGRPTQCLAGRRKRHSSRRRNP